MKKKIFISIGVIVLLGIAILVSQSIKGVSEVPVPIVAPTAEPTPEPIIEPIENPTEEPILYEIKPLIAEEAPVEEEAPAKEEQKSIVTPKEEATPEPTPTPKVEEEPKKEETASPAPTQAPAQEAPQQTQPSGGITPEGQALLNQIIADGGTLGNVEMTHQESQSMGETGNVWE